QPTRLRQRQAEMGNKPQPVRVGAWKQRGGPTEEVRGSGDIESQERAVPGGAEARGRRAADRKPVLAEWAERTPVRVRLLQVVAQDFLVLRHVVRGASLQPGRKALVQAGSRLLRKRLVGSVPDEQVTEAETVLAREVRLPRPDQLLADERQEV